VPGEGRAAQGTDIHEAWQADGTRLGEPVEEEEGEEQGEE